MHGEASYNELFPCQFHLMPNHLTSALGLDQEAVLEVDQKVIPDPGHEHHLQTIRVDHRRRAITGLEHRLRAARRNHVITHDRLHRHRIRNIEKGLLRKRPNQSLFKIVCLFLFIGNQEIVNVRIIMQIERIATSIETAIAIAVKKIAPLSTILGIQVVAEVLAAQAAVIRDVIVHAKENAKF